MNTIFLVVACLTTANAFSLKPIIGGEDAKPGQSPWQAWVLYGGQPMCGASLIGQNTVLTAGHCCDGHTSEASQYKVQYGGNDRENLKYSSAVSKVILHPDYTSFQYGNDVCVLVLTDHVKVGQDVKLIEIADVSPLNGTAANLTGWGRTNAQSDILPRYLQYANLTVLNQTECDKIWSKVDVRIVKTMICSEKHTTSFCNGDSGGALVVKNKVVGVVSFGHAGFPTDTYVWPNVYADAASEKPWILKQVALYSK